MKILKVKEIKRFILKNTILKYLLVVGFLALLIACSTKKDSFTRRGYHAVTAEYNILYNGQLAFDKGVEDLKATYKDNFWDILPVERMQEKTEMILPGQTKNANFERAETKATKAVQKHSMNIEGSEKNPQMDEAHLLLGKARYYDNRFLPALEAFNYILYKYSNSDKIYEAKIWREKTNIRLENDAQAIKNLKMLLKDRKLKGQVHADANAILTQAYLNTNVKDTAIARLKTARELTEHNEEKARYNFILGQLYESLNYPDSAYTAFQEVINMKRRSPRRYVIWAHAKQAQQFDYKNGDTLAFSEKYDKLLKDRENRPYLDVINHQKGLFYDKQNKNKEAKKYYNKSLRSVSQDNYLMASNYRNLAAIYFEDAQYRTAGKYYDSTMLKLDLKSREYFAVKKKRENLDDVIKYEDIVHSNDSILKVVAMNENDRRNFYETYIVTLKRNDERKALEALKKAEKEQQQNQGGVRDPQQGTSDEGPKGGKMMPPSGDSAGMNPPSMLPPTAQPRSVMDMQSNFYFYNPTTVAYGKSEFRKKWGNRKLKDDWRWSSVSDKMIDNQEDAEQSVQEEGIKTEDAPEVKPEKPEYAVDFYLKQLPTDQKTIDSLARDRNFAYFQLGNIYKEKFREYELAASKLETLLTKNPEERLVLPTKYNLYKIYEIINPGKAEAMRQEIISDYPNSHYAQILSNNAVQINDSPAVVYGNLFKEYERGEYQETLKQTELMLQNFAGDEMAPKFELLRARIVARLEGVAEYKKILTEIAKNYPSVDEGKQADALVKNDIPKLEALELGKGTPASWKIVYQIPYPNAADAKVKVLNEKLQKYIKDRNSEKITLSNDVYLADRSFLIVHGFSSKEGALATISVLKDFKGYKIQDVAFVISNEDYKVIQIKKNLPEYLATIK